MPFPKGMTQHDPGRSAIDGLRVLLVDDELALRAPIARYLRRRGVWVTEAGDGEHALRRLEREPVDVVVADVRMPVMDGEALLVALERRRSPLAARLVFVTGDEDARARLASLPLLGGRVFAKPVELPVLEAAIAAAACSSGTATDTSATAAAGR